MRSAACDTSQANASKQEQEDTLTEEPIMGGKEKSREDVSHDEL
jgi:hypothetical protein